MFFGKVYYHLLSTGETNIPLIAFYFCLIQNLVSFYAYGTEILYTLTLWEVVGHSKRMMHATYLIIIHETGPGIKLATFGLVNDFSTKEGNLLLRPAQPLN